MDVFTKEKRSQIMSKIRSKETKAEVEIFRALKRESVYFQKHYKKAFGTPDIALPRKKIAVFIDGDFWHGYQFSKNKHRLPKKYWLEKIQGNIKRDKKNMSRLKKNGWKVLRIWEHQIYEEREKTIRQIIQFLVGESP